MWGPVIQFLVSESRPQPLTAIFFPDSHNLSALLLAFYFRNGDSLSMNQLSCKSAAPSTTQSPSTFPPHSSFLDIYLLKGASGEMLESERCSGVSKIPKYKRRRVSAVRTFPPGCGPSASKDTFRGNAGEDYCVDAQPAADTCLEVENKTTLSSSEDPSVVLEAGELELLKLHTGIDTAAAFPGVEKFKTPDAQTQSPASLGVVLEVAEQEMQNEERSFDEVPESENKKTSSVKNSVHVVLKSIEHEMMMDEHLSDMSGELLPRSSHSSEELLPELQKHSRDLIECKQEAMPAVLDKGGKKMPVQEEKMVTTDKLPPLCVISPKDVCKERNYPPRGRVSAIRDFPPGCGTNPSYSSERQYTMAELQRNMSVEMENTKPAYDRKMEKGATEASDREKAIAYRNDKEDKKEYTVNDTSVQAKEMEFMDDAKHTMAVNDTSAIRDLPPGCGTNPSYSSERQNTMAELQRSMSVEREKTKLAYSRKMEKGATEASDSENAIAYRNDKEDKKGYTVNDTSVQAKEMEFKDAVKHTGQGPIGVSNIHSQQGIATIQSRVGAENSRQEKDCVIKQARFKLKPYYYEPKKDNEEKKTVAGRGKVLRWDAMNSSENFSRQKHLPPTGASSLTDAVAHNKVRETLRLFQALIRKFSRREEPNSKEQKKYIRRIDLHALSIFKEKGLYRNAGNPIIGHVPGVEVGAEFHYRVELMIIGLHHPSQGGIGCMKQGEMTLATSVVDSGGYDNRVDNYDVWTYTGQGGNLNTRDKVPEDQKLERGNLALKNSIKAKNLVRVIRGVKDTDNSEGKSKVSTTYTYYGVYTVERYWQEIGTHGIKEYKYELKRVPGQRELPWHVVKRSKKLRVKDGLCVSDISGGKEQFPICAVNTIDEEKPPPFTYITRMIYSSYKPLRARGCDCIKGCSNSIHCSCVVKNGGSIPYNFDGAIVEAKPVVYECGPCCKCPASCYNRVSQLGITFQLEIFKTESRGWGVRSLSSIPSGGFICEYTGELLEDSEAEKRTGNDEYLFDIGQNRNDHSIWDGLSGLLPSAASSSQEVVEDSRFTIDAAKYGNVGRFINHSCSPNLYAQNVLYDHADTRVPHIMLFAAENIPPLQELTYHYNYKLGQVFNKDGSVKVKHCYCGSPDCIGRLY